MPECMIAGIPVNFPFEPYEIQKAYMSKVIECLQNGTNGVLESPTGTGKTLSLLCSTLAWIITKKAQVQASVQAKKINFDNDMMKNEGFSGSTSNLAQNLINNLNYGAGGEGANWGVPKVIYASRTHSQLTQAMQELKRSSYSFMRAVVLGSRDQLCIHPEVSKETTNSNKLHMCKLRLLTRSCSFHLKVDSNKDNPQLLMQTVMDIEDLVTVGRKLKMCPYYGSKELVQNADIIFMPYNYLLDPTARKANKIELNNTIVILDEAHNVEKMCEESASIQIKSSDIAICIDEVTHVMKALSEEPADSNDEVKDFTVDDLGILKEMLLDLEKAVDEIDVMPLSGGKTFPGGFMFDLLAKSNVTANNFSIINTLIENLIQFLTAASQQNPMFRRGAGLQILNDLITVIFAGKEDEEKIKRCFKVHVDIEEAKPQKNSTKKDGWITPKGGTTTRSRAKVINYWCFNPGFGMEQLLNKNVRSIILTSGTLAPLKPLIAELGIPVSVRLENPHIVGKSQVYVKIIPFGPDKEPLNSNYKNRDNPKYISSLGRTILSFCPIIPDGLLVFFPSYTLLNKCADSWQASGIWSQIQRHKPIFVEPRSKDAFNTTMTDFYANIDDPLTKGACFMAVCRGKVSEGLDFADRNGRAVIITGLPYPPMTDPRVILKKKYLEDNRTKENELLSGDSWYGLEGIRAVNQAIGRVIRHKNDYGAILLCDSRFSYSTQKNQLSAWIQEHLRTSQQYSTFGPYIGEISRFFRNADSTLPKPILRELKPLEIVTEQDIKPVRSEQQLQLARDKYNAAQQTAIKVEKANEVTSWNPDQYKSAFQSIKTKVSSGNDFMSRLDEKVSTIDFNKRLPKSEPETSLVTIHKRERTSPLSLSSFGSQKKRKLKLISNTESIIMPLHSSNVNSSILSIASTSASSNDSDVMIVEPSLPADRSELLKLIKNSVPPDMYSIFVKALMSYQKDNQFEQLFAALIKVFHHKTLHYLLKGMRRFVKEVHKNEFDNSVGSFTL